MPADQKTIRVPLHTISRQNFTFIRSCCLWSDHIHNNSSRRFTEATTTVYKINKRKKKWNANDKNSFFDFALSDVIRFGKSNFRFHTLKKMRWDVGMMTLYFMDVVVLYVHRTHLTHVIIIIIILIAAIVFDGIQHRRCMLTVSYTINA